MALAWLRSGNTVAKLLKYSMVLKCLIKGT